MRKSTNIAVSGLLVLGFIIGGASSAAAQTVTTTTTTSQRYVANLMGANTLSIGSTGAAVVELQGILSELGFLTVPRGVALGYFGPLTRSALMTYQATRGVAATGVFDASTKLALQSHLVANGWMNSSGVIAMGSSSNNSSSNSSSNTSNTSNTSVSASASTNSTTKAPAGMTGYWFDGNWYNSLPWVGTTTVSSNITEYWYNGTRYTISQVPDPKAPGDTNVAINNTTTGKGYWFNGVWTAIDPDDIRGGYYSPNPGFAVGGANYQQGGNGYFQTFTYTPAISE
jgi:peptidoglycan hydrolase-like protein with peptidoglycan-binding domain